MNDICGSYFHTDFFLEAMPLFVSSLRLFRALQKHLFDFSHFSVTIFPKKEMNIKHFFFFLDFWRQETSLEVLVSITECVSVREIVKEVCEAIWNNLGPLVMPEPTEEMWKKFAKNIKPCGIFQTV